MGGTAKQENIRKKARKILRALLRLATKHGGKPFQVEINGKNYTVVPRMAKVVVGKYVKEEVATYTFPRSVAGLEATAITVIVKGVGRKPAEVTVTDDGTILVFPKQEEAEAKKFLDALANCYGGQEVS